MVVVVVVGGGGVVVVVVGVRVVVVSSSSEDLPWLAATKRDLERLRGLSTLTTFLFRTTVLSVADSSSSGCSGV